MYICTTKFNLLFGTQTSIFTLLPQGSLSIKTALCSEQYLRSRSRIEKLGVDIAVLPEIEHAFNLAMEEISSLGTRASN